MILVCARLWQISKILQVGSNWNNALNTRPGYQNANNTASNSNRNNGVHLELRLRPSWAALNSALTGVLRKIQGQIYNLSAGEYWYPFQNGGRFSPTARAFGGFL